MYCAQCGEFIPFNEERYTVKVTKYSREKRFFIFKTKFVSEKNYHVDHYEVK